jgi:hypothetical protein
VSPNSHYLWGNVEWSSDASRIAYIMATGPFGLRPDVAENDQEAVLTTWSDDRTAKFSVIGLGQPDDAREKLATTSSATWTSLWRAPK